MGVVVEKKSEGARRRADPRLRGVRTGGGISADAGGGAARPRSASEGGAIAERRRGALAASASQLQSSVSRTEAE